MPPDQLSTSLWNMALGFLRIVWMNFRVHELFWGSSPALSRRRRLQLRGLSSFGLRSAEDGHHPHNCCNHVRGRDGRESPPTAPLSPLFHGFEYLSSLSAGFYGEFSANPKIAIRARGGGYPQDILVPTGSGLETANSCAATVKSTAGSLPGPWARFGMTTVGYFMAALHRLIRLAPLN
jgi:hypothetical protein